MTYDHMVKKNGIYYNAGQEVPDEEDSSGASFNDVGEKVDKEPYSIKKSDISRMPKEELVKMGMWHGIQGAAEMTGGELKKALIEKFGL